MKIAIYPGSFDPITNGHVDIINRASNLFDRLIITVASNNTKKALLSIDRRVDILNKTFSNKANIEIDYFNGLLVDYAIRKNVFTIVRGLRTLSDFEYEFRMAIINRNLDKRIETIFLMTDEKYSHISSSSIKEIYNLNGNINQFVPKTVSKTLCNLKNEKNNK
ncbi:MAG: pantetheine-phosphate adenylyltransferase [Candidatus Marinimicrobia bacterium]|nr:pantetheine-phosphate adenylyltransferase [Candidatus Neomarinimicrobiota bacterium]